MHDEFEQGDRVRYVGDVEALHNVTGTVQSHGDMRFVPVVFDQAVQIGSRTDKFWRCPRSELERADDVIPEIQYSFDDFLRGGASNE